MKDIKILCTYHILSHPSPYYRCQWFGKVVSHWPWLSDTFPFLGYFVLFLVFCCFGWLLGSFTSFLHQYKYTPGIRRNNASKNILTCGFWQWFFCVKITDAGIHLWREPTNCIATIAFLCQDLESNPKARGAPIKHMHA